MSKNSKIIYLGVDGVLNQNSAMHRKYALHDTVTVLRDKHDLLKSYLDSHPEIGIVIVSAFGPEWTSKTFCEQLGLPYHSDAFYSGDGYGRGRGVTLHAQHYHIQSEDYVVVDSGANLYYEDMRRCVKVNAHVGLSEMDLERVEALLFGG